MLFHQNIQRSDSKPGISIPLEVHEWLTGCTQLFCFITMGYKLSTIIYKKVQKGYSINIGGTQMGRILILRYASTKRWRLADLK